MQQSKREKQMKNRKLRVIYRGSFETPLHTINRRPIVRYQLQFQVHMISLYIMLLTI